MWPDSSNGHFGCNSSPKYGLEVKLGYPDMKEKKNMKGKVLCHMSQLLDDLL